MPEIFILLPVHNRRDLTERFARCLAAQTYRRYRLLLIDDGSTDGTADVVTSLLPQTTVLTGSGHWWWAGSLQQGLNWLRREKIDDRALVLMINDDLQIEPDYLERAVGVMRDKEGCLVLSQLRGTTAGREESATHADLRTLDFSVAASPADVNCLSTQGLFGHWKDVERIGDFHPRLLPHYLSDYEYTIRAHRRGLKLESSPDLLIDLDRDTTGYHQIAERNFLVFLRKFLSIKNPGNPFYFSAFVVLACPARRIVPNIVRIWFNVCRAITYAMKQSVKHAIADRTVRL